MAMFNWFPALFLSPWLMVAGGILIASPILIHLINRMRFKRIRWAAMEFLLKSQKRNRRRLIIEQLILLALRCFLVILAGLLVARFVGAAFKGKTDAVSHLIIIDDTLSMTDQTKDKTTGKDTTAFDTAKAVAKDIVKRNVPVSAPQRIKVIRLSQCEPLTFMIDDKLNQVTSDELNTKLDDKDAKQGCTLLHVSPLVALRTAAKLLGDDPEPKKYFYFISDFRDRDWKETEGEEAVKALKGLTDAGVRVKLVDVANPPRGDTRLSVKNNDNLAVTQLLPESRVAPLDIPIQFSLTVHNYGSTDAKNIRVAIKWDGVEAPEASMTIQDLHPGANVKTFQMAFNKEGFHEVTAEIPPEKVGLQADNIRYAVMEVKRQVPVLVIDGDGPSGQKRPGGTYFLQNLFGAARGYKVVPASVDILKKPTLAEYPCIFILNVREFDEESVKNLEKYVNDGGGVAFFMGKNVNAARYNATLYKDGQGLFPVPLETAPTEEKLEETEKIMRLLAQQPSIFIRDDQHPLFAPVYKEDPDHSVDKFFPYLSIEKYYAVRKSKWKKTEKLDELITLPNRRDVVGYRDRAAELNEQMRKLADEPKYKTYKPALERYYRAIKDGLGNKYEHLFQLSLDLDHLLHDVGDKEAKDKDRPNLVEFWSLPDDAIKSLRRDLGTLHESVRFGDPLVVTNRVGKGRVVAFLTAIGQSPDSVGAPGNEAWNDMPGGPGAPAFAVFMLSLQRYLASTSDQSGYVLGSPFEIKLDATRYEPRVRRFIVSRTPEPAQKDDDLVEELEAAKRAGLDDLGEQQPNASSTKEVSYFTFRDARKPGMYVLHVYPKAEPGARSKPETIAVAYNVDTAAESDLKRAPGDALLSGGGDQSGSKSGNRVLTDPNGQLVDKEQKTDLSENPWFYIVFLLVLVIEQALAVHLSFHLKGNEAQLPAAAARTQPTAA
jgi:hypothetical protein